MENCLKTIWSCLCWAIISFVGIAHAAEPVKVVVDAYNPPNMFLRDGRAAGLYPLILEAVFKRMGQSVSIDAVPWKRAVEMGALGLAGVSGFYKTPERIKIYDYSDVVYNELLLVFVKHGRQFEFNSIEDLRHKKIGVLLGWSYGAEFDQAKAERAFTVEEVNRDYLNFRKLNEGRLDCVVASKESGLFEIGRNNYSSIYPLKQAVLINPTYIAFAKSSNRLELLSRFNDSLRELKESGEYQKLVGDYMDQIDAGGIVPSQ